MYDVIVIGIGGMGSAAIHHLAARGASVLGLEQFDIPNDQGSSHGFSRIIRLPYWEDPLYVPLVRRAFALWRELERVAHEQLLFVTGSVDAGAEGSRHVLGVRAACREFELSHEELDPVALTKRFPGYQLPHDCIAIYQADGGFLDPERCIVAHVQAARRSGAVVQTNEAVLGWDAIPNGVRVRTTRGTYDGARLVLTAGPWTASLLPALAPDLTPERQVMLWTQPLRPEYFEVGRFPVFYISLREGSFYGYP